MFDCDDDRIDKTTLENVTSDNVGSKHVIHVWFLGVLHL